LIFPLVGASAPLFSQNIKNDNMKKCIEVLSEVDIFIEYFLKPRRIADEQGLASYEGYDEETGTCPHFGSVYELVAYVPFKKRTIRVNMEGRRAKYLLKKLLEAIDEIEEMEERKNPFGDE